jgi:hypothetical protein
MRVRISWVGALCDGQGDAHVSEIVKPAPHASSGPCPREDVPPKLDEISGYPARLGEHEGRRGQPSRNGLDAPPGPMRSTVRSLIEPTPRYSAPCATTPPYRAGTRVAHRLSERRLLIRCPLYDRRRGSHPPAVFRAGPHAPRTRKGPQRGCGEPIQTVGVHET